jgi:hypothetical protein
MKRVIAIIGLLFAISAGAQEFSAKFHTVGNDGPAGMIYVTPSHLRAEVAQDGEVMVLLIQRSKKPKMQQLELRSKTFSAIDVGNNPDILAGLQWILSRNREFCNAPGVQTCKFIGLKTVDNRTCDQYQASDADGDTHKACFDQELRFPLYYENVSNAGDGPLEIYDVQIGKQPTWLFVVPSGFRKIDAVRGCRLPPPPPPPKLQP